MNGLELIKSNTWSRTGLLSKSLGALAFAFLTILSAQIRIPLPFTPVPMTLQTFVVPLAGGVLGAGWGSFSMLLYLCFGMLGFDVFAAASAGTGFFAAPTAGYLLSYPLVAMLIGWIRSASKSNLLLFFAILFSHLLIFAFGVTGLIFNAGMTIQEAILKGVVPFLPGDVIKITATFLALLSLDLVRKHPNS